MKPKLVEINSIQRTVQEQVAISEAALAASREAQARGDTDEVIKQCEIAIKASARSIEAALPLLKWRS